jgi:two-component system, LytTR family, sensor kinase
LTAGAGRGTMAPCPTAVTRPPPTCQPRAALPLPGATMTPPDQPSPASPRRWWAWPAVVFAVCTLLGLINAGQSSLHAFLANRPISWWRVAAVGLFDWYVWAALTPFVLWLARRRPLRAGRWALPLLLHADASVALALLVITLDVPVVLALRQAPAEPLSPSQLWHRYFFLEFHLYVLLYWALLCVGHALAYHRDARDRRLEAARLEGRLARAELDALKMQLDPHFLFNTLNAISALMHRDVELADRMVARLGDLLRLTLGAAAAPEVPLAQELDFVGRYLEIQKARLGSRLAVTLDIEPGTLAARVPALVLQPLVENAIRHGVAPRPGGGRVEVRSRRREGALHLEVRDDGPGLPAEGADGRREGVGLANTRARLRHLYGPDHRLELSDGGAGVVVTLAIPFRTGEGAEDRQGTAPPAPALLGLG